jgi:hypothetical protein
MTKVFQPYGSLKYMRSRTQDIVTDSVWELKTLKEGKARQTLIETIKFIAYRTT